jgi:hypothetical protein
MNSTLLLAAVMLACTVYAADPREAEIHKAQEAFGHCWDAHSKDTHCMDQLLTTDFSWVSLGARSEDRTAFIERIQKMPESNTWTTPPDDTIHFYGPTAIVTYGVQHSTPVSHMDQFTHVWVNVDGKGWRMARLHCSHPTLPSESKK